MARLAQSDAARTYGLAGAWAALRHHIAGSAHWPADDAVPVGIFRHLSDTNFRVLAQPIVFYAQSDLRRACWAYCATFVGCLLSYFQKAPDFVKNAVEF